jgi:hypothetical protein
MFSIRFKNQLKRCASAVGKHATLLLSTVVFVVSAQATDTTTDPLPS